MKKNKLSIITSLLASSSIGIIPILINQTASTNTESNDSNTWLILIGVGAILFIIGLILLIVGLTTKNKDKKNKVQKTQQPIVVNKQQGHPAIATIPCKSTSTIPTKTPDIKKEM